MLHKNLYGIGIFCSTVTIWHIEITNSNSAKNILFQVKIVMNWLIWINSNKKKNRYKVQISPKKTFPSIQQTLSNSLPHPAKLVKTLFSGSNPLRRSHRR